MEPWKQIFLPVFMKRKNRESVPSALQVQAAKAVYKDKILGEGHVSVTVPTCEYAGN